MTNPVDNERGSGSVLILGVCAAALVLFGALACLASAQLASVRARTAADFAVLAAAGADARGDPGNACGQAAAVADANHAAVTRCAALGAGRYEVVVAVRPTFRALGAAVARSRAGPAVAAKPS